MSAIWRRAGQLRAQGVPFAAAMRQARWELDPAYRFDKSEILRWFAVPEHMVAGRIEPWQERLLERLLRRE